MPDVVITGFDPADEPAMLRYLSIVAAFGRLQTDGWSLNIPVPRYWKVLAQSGDPIVIAAIDAMRGLEQAQARLGGNRCGECVFGDHGNAIWGIPEEAEAEFDRLRRARGLATCDEVYDRDPYEWLDCDHERDAWAEKTGRIQKYSYQYIGTTKMSSARLRRDRPLAEALAKFANECIVDGGILYLPGCWTAVHREFLETVVRLIDRPGLRVRGNQELQVMGHFMWEKIRDLGMHAENNFGPEGQIYEATLVGQEVQFEPVPPTALERRLP